MFLKRRVKRKLQEMLDDMSVSPADICWDFAVRRGERTLYSRRPGEQVSYLRDDLPEPMTHELAHLIMVNVGAAGRGEEPGVYNIIDTLNWYQWGMTAMFGQSTDLQLETAAIADHLTSFLVYEAFASYITQHYHRGYLPAWQWADEELATKEDLLQICSMCLDDGLAAELLHDAVPKTISITAEAYRNRVQSILDQLSMYEHLMGDYLASKVIAHEEMIGFDSCVSMFISNTLPNLDIREEDYDCAKHIDWVTGVVNRFTASQDRAS
jgi:hypothetical protein